MTTAAERHLINTRPSDDTRTPEELERDADAVLQFFERLGKAKERAGVRADAPARPRRGTVARGGRQVPWQRAVNPGTPPNFNALPLETLARKMRDGQGVEEVMSNIPKRPVVGEVDIPPLFPRRTPQARVEQIFQMLFNDTLEHYKRTGRFDLPQSMMNELLTELWRQGKAVTLEDVRAWAEPEIRSAMQVYAQTLLTKVNNRYDHNDRVPEIRSAAPPQLNRATRRKLAKKKGK